jgi:hypothetical protein
MERENYNMHSRLLLLALIAFWGWFAAELNGIDGNSFPMHGYQYASATLNVAAPCDAFCASESDADDVQLSWFYYPAVATIGAPSWPSHAIQIFRPCRCSQTLESQHVLLRV